jgi:hypothetical protein
VPSWTRLGMARLKCEGRLSGIWVEILLIAETKLPRHKVHMKGGVLYRKRGLLRMVALTQLALKRML